MSAVTLLGNPAEMYNYGTQFFMIGIGYMMTTPITAYLFMPVYYRLELTSAYEVYNYLMKDIFPFNFYNCVSCLVLGDEVQQSGAITGLHYFHFPHGKS